MSELDEIMNGKYEMRGFRIEGDTIGFDTPQSYGWNLSPRDIETIIYTLQQELERYKNNIKSAFDVINTQMKNLSKEEAENLRIIKFNLIKGSCTFEDLKTEEDYKY